MPALTGGQLALLRGERQRGRFYLSVSRPRTLLTGQVNNGSIARGATSIAYDNGAGSGYSSIQAGQVLQVVTATRTEAVRIKAISGSQTSGTITVASNSILWGDNQALTVIEDYPIVPKNPYFNISGAFYKDGDIAYSDQNEEPPPVVIAGPHRAQFLDDEGETYFQFRQSDCYAIAPGASLSSLAVSVAPSAGVTITNEGGGSWSAIITTAGQYWAKLTATDSNGKTQVSYRRLWAHSTDPTDEDYPYTDFTIETLAGAWGRGGWSLGITVHGTADESDFPPGALICLWYQVKYGDDEEFIGGWDNGMEVLFTGYIRQGTVQADWDHSTVSFEAVSPTAVLAEIVIGSNAFLEAKASPANWNQYKNTALTTGRALHHYLLWHSTILECTDVAGLLDDSTLRAGAVFQKSDLYSQVLSVCEQQGINAKLVSDHQGRLYLVRNLQLRNDTDRAAATTTVTLTETDRVGEIGIVDQQSAEVAMTFANGFTFDGTTVAAVCARSPGSTPHSSGTQFETRSGQIVPNQTAINQLAGRFWATANKPYKEVRLKLHGIWAGVADILGDEWWAINVAPTGNNRGIDWVGQKALVRSVNHKLDPVNGYIETDLVLEPEALGPAGVGYTCVGLPTEIATPSGPRWTPPATEECNNAINEWTFDSDLESWTLVGDDGSSLSHSASYGRAALGSMLIENHGDNNGDTIQLSGSWSVAAGDKMWFWGRLRDTQTSEASWQVVATLTPDNYGEPLSAILEFNYIGAPYDSGWIKSTVVEFTAPITFTLLTFSFYGSTEWHIDELYIDDIVICGD
jgi:hypothetical protein